MVVVAYGETTRRKFTGSLASIGAGEIEQIPQTSALQMMQGRAAGVLVENNSGRPGAIGSIVIRGVGTLGGETSPLFVIDGTPTNRFVDVNPNDIASISVLKDAAATSIYGSRAANGVVLITTKSGQSGATKFTLNARIGFSNLENPNDFRMMNAAEYKDYYREAYVNAGENPDDPTSGFYLPPNADSINTDWLDEVLQTGITQLYELTASGGGEKTRHFISASYFNQEGTVTGTEFERLTGRINFGFTPAKRLNIDLKVLGAFTDEALQFSDGGRGGTFSGAFNVAPTASPFATESTPANLSGLGFNFDLPSNAGHNPLATATIRSNDRTRVRAFPTIRLTYEPIDKLTLSSSASVDYTFRKRNAFQSKFYFAETDNGLAELETETFTETNFNATATYEYVINSDHVITPLVGFETFKSTFEGEESATRDFAFDGIDNFAAGAIPLSRDFDFESNTLVSFFSRVNYSFKNKLFLDASYRRDGSSRFGPENRWGNSYAFGVGYNLVDEAFMQSVRDIFSELRLRASFGLQGNNAIGDFAFRNTYSIGGVYIVPPSGGGTGVPNSGSQPNEPGNPALKWEQSETLNVGIDFGMSNNRLAGTVEYYHRASKDLLAERIISRTSGFSSVIDNIGDVENKGIELSLNSTNLQIGDFTWTSAFNISFNDNKIVSLNGESDTLFVDDADGNGDADNRLIRIVGQPLDQWFLPQYAGVDPATGMPMYFTEGEQGRGITSDINQAAITVSGQSTLTPDCFGHFIHKSL